MWMIDKCLPDDMSGTEVELKDEVDQNEGESKGPGQGTEGCGCQCSHHR